MSGTRPATDPSARPKVLLVASAGGHLAHLVRLDAWTSGTDRAWVTFDKADARSLLADETVTWAHHPTTRNVPNLLRNARLAYRMLRRDRPDVIVSSGAGAAIPFFVLAWLWRIPSVYVEVFDRIESRTVTGRVCHPIATRFLVQWPEQQALYPGSILIGPLL